MRHISINRHDTFEISSPKQIINSHNIDLKSESARGCFRWIGEDGHEESESDSEMLKCKISTHEFK